MIKSAPTMLQSIPPPTTFSVQAQAPPTSLLQAQLSAASLAPLLQNPPQPLLPQPPTKEIRYHRPEETHKGRTVPAHVETVVLFLPDVWHCLPTRSEWDVLSRRLQEQLAEKLSAERKEADGEQALNR
ncbi:hypothetical protein XENOCAPTIV_004539 [Xenoophorus captivus]|uniref:DBC1/CARP1 catalytically inactive NUDIX hydrolase domain-containing protein n=1 Tax=Xenoophorus captivus TaxID=1517983 RepID=A0ABV0QLA0_9TELE